MNYAAAGMLVVIVMVLGWIVVDYCNETPCQGCGRRLGAARYGNGIWCARCREEIEMEDR